MSAQILHCAGLLKEAIVFRSAVGAHLVRRCSAEASVPPGRRPKSDAGDRETEPSRRYAATLNLPKMPFPLSVYMTDGRSARREMDIHQLAKFDELYAWQRQRASSSEFVLHDGPPYANGMPHVGHALNKIIKDIINRWHVMKGDKVHFMLGWDCHGLPIELKALQASKRRESVSAIKDPLSIRKQSREFAQKTIEQQRAQFRRWGVMADWTNCYYTFSSDYVANQLEVFLRMYEKGFVYRDYMPVYWSPSSRTALAEAELEYNEEHKSPSAYVRLLLKRVPLCLQDAVGDSAAYVVVWTTTPWTLPANEAVCYGKELRYALVHDARTNSFYVMSADKVSELSTMIGTELVTRFSVLGSELDGATYVHPFRKERECPLLAGDHVTSSKGTGLVHTAPAHGHDDFKVALKHKLSKECMVDEEGHYRQTAGPELAGLNVLTAGNRKVLASIADDVLHEAEYVHSYPYDWRTKKPVLLRASSQWFVDNIKLQERSLDCLSDIKVVPGLFQKAMTNILSQRPYWCISRQRVWGVPIPVFYEQASGTPVITRPLVERVIDVIRKHGVDSWWTLRTDQLLPEDVKLAAGLDPSKEYVRGSDILDIWFDSGTSWATVLKGHSGKADVYLEGLDQFGGWFQSSLLTSVAVNGHAPYRQLLVHGFAVDESGKKMSKSLGNVVEPNVIIDGGKDKQREPAYGADVLRWWAANKFGATNAEIGPASLRVLSEQLLLLRKRLRFVLGNLHDFDRESRALPYADLLVQDKYMLHLLHGYATTVSRMYENHEYGAVLQELQRFTTVHLSNFYSTLIKDRLYCWASNSKERRSAQTVLERCLDVVVRSFAPILPFFAEDIFYHHPQKTFRAGELSVFKTGWINAPQLWRQDVIAKDMEVIGQIGHGLRNAIGNDQPSEHDVSLLATPALFRLLSKYQSESQSSFSALCEVLMASSVDLEMIEEDVTRSHDSTVEGAIRQRIDVGAIGESAANSDGSGEPPQHCVLIARPASRHCCERCRRYLTQTPNEPCERCLHIMAGDWA